MISLIGTKTAGFNRMRFLLESLNDLDQSFKKHGGRLFVFTGDPINILSHLFQARFDHNVLHVITICIKKRGLSCCFVTLFLCSISSHDCFVNFKIWVFSFPVCGDDYCTNECWFSLSIFEFHILVSNTSDMYMCTFISVHKPL